MSGGTCDTMLRSILILYTSAGSTQIHSRLSFSCIIPWSHPFIFISFWARFGIFMWDTGTFPTLKADSNLLQVDRRCVCPEAPSHRLWTVQLKTLSISLVKAWGAPCTMDSDTPPLHLHSEPALWCQSLWALVCHFRVPLQRVRHSPWMAVRRE